MRGAAALVLALGLAGQAAAQDTPAPKNGVIAPGQNVDPGMKVVPPRTPTRTPVVHPPGRPRTDRRHDTVVVPK